MCLLVLNTGSSSIKYSLFLKDSLKLLCTGSVNDIGHTNPLTHQQLIGEVEQRYYLNNESYDFILSEVLTHISSHYKVDYVAHRFVHGGKDFLEPIELDSKSLSQLKALNPLAPLHNPNNICGIEHSVKVMPDARQFAVFDTAFHHTLPDYAKRYALPKSITKQYDIQRYGFHGIAHAYSLKQVAQFLNKSITQINMISLHLGSGASATAIKEGKSIDTTMGMSPLAGLMMSTRCGDLDPGVILYLMQNGFTESQLSRLLNSESGLKGVCSTSNMGDIVKRANAGDHNANIAIQMFCYQIRKTIGAYLAILGEIDAISFSGGIGENSTVIREQICTDLAHLGIQLDTKRNTSHIHEDVTPIKANDTTLVVVVKTDEAYEIASQIQDKFFSSAIK